MAFIINKNRIASNTIALYIRLGITMIISFFTARVTLEQLGVEDYGLNNLVGSIVSMFSFINGSMGTAVQRFFSIEIGKDNQERLGRVFGVGLYLHIIVALLTLLIAEFFAVFFLQKLNIPQDRMVAAHVVFQVSVISLILNIINVPNAALLRAREMFSKMAVIEIVQALLRLVVLYLLVHINYDKLITLSILNLCITVYYVTSLFIMARKFSESHNRPIRDKDLIKQMLVFISMLLVTVFAQLLKTQGIVILINLFFGLIINAAYAIAVQVSNIVNSFVINFKQAMVPQMISAYGAGDTRVMSHLIDFGTKVAFLLMMMITTPVIFDAQFILSIWLKTPPEYSAHLVVLVLIAINISSFTYFQYQGVHATGKIIGQQIWMSVTYMINILIIYVIFKLGGSFDSALYVNMAVGLVQCVINLLYAKKTYEYDIHKFLTHLFFPCLCLVIGVSIPLFFTTQLLSPSLGRFIIVFVLSELLISVLGFYVVFDKTDRERLITYIYATITKQRTTKTSFR